MKKLIIISMLIGAILAINTTYAYTPTSADQQLAQAAKTHIERLYPEHVHQLLEIYTKLEGVTAYAEARFGARGRRLIETLQKLLVEQLFETTNVCLSSYSQVGDTVEVMYTVYDTAGELLRQTAIPLAFNPGKEQVWKSLDQNILGLQAGQKDAAMVPTLTVVADEGTRLKTFPREGIEFVHTPTIGTKYVFGATNIPGATIGTVVAIDDETVTFNFEDSPTDKEITLKVSLERLRKGCLTTSSN